MAWFLAGELSFISSLPNPERPWDTPILLPSDEGSFAECKDDRIVQLATHLNLVSVSRMLGDFFDLNALYGEISPDSLIHSLAC
jgi:hypothetical protein